MPRLNVKNNAITELSSTISDSVDTFAVVDASLLPSAPFVITVGNEIMEVGHVASNTLSSITRGAEDTTAASHSAGATVEARFTAGIYDELDDMARTIATGVQYETNFDSGETDEDENWVPTGWNISVDSGCSITMDSSTSLSGISPVLKLQGALASVCSISKTLDFDNIRYINFLMKRYSAGETETGFMLNVDSSVFGYDLTMISVALGDEEFLSVEIDVDSYNNGSHVLSIDLMGDAALWIYGFSLTSRPLEMSSNILTSVSGIEGKRLEEVLPNLKTYVDTRVPKDNLTATTDPTASNDQTQGYAIKSVWVNTIDNGTFICANAATGAAVWKEIV